MIRMIGKSVQVLVMFAVMTAFFYMVLTYLDGREQRVHRYDQPGIDAVKVGTGLQIEHFSLRMNDKLHLSERLIEFLRDGE
ncbi:MAG: DUF4227 family protein [Sporolactobacillus sp.]